MVVGLGRFTPPPEDFTAELAETAERAASFLGASVLLASTVGCFSFRGLSALSASSAVFSFVCFFFARSPRLFSCRVLRRHPPATPPSTSRRPQDGSSTPRSPSRRQSPPGCACSEQIRHTHQCRSPPRHTGHAS